MENTKPDLHEGETHTEISNDRLMVALEASWEIEELSGALIANLPRDDGGNFLLTRGISARIQDLSRAIMSTLSDQIDPTRRLNQIVTRDRKQQEADQ